MELQHVSQCLGAWLISSVFVYLLSSVEMFKKSSILRFLSVLATLDFVMSENAGDEALLSVLYFPCISSSN